MTQIIACDKVRLKINSSYAIEVIQGQTITNWLLTDGHQGITEPKMKTRGNLLKIFVSNEKSLFEWKYIFSILAFVISSWLVSCNDVDFFLVIGKCMSHTTAC